MAFSLRSVFKLRSLAQPHLYSSNKNFHYMTLKNVDLSSVILRHVYWTVSKDDLIGIASKYGEVENINYPFDKNGFHTGLAEVKFKDKNSSALMLEDKRIEFENNIMYTYKPQKRNF